MCMLCVAAPGLVPDREKLENSALNNPHGYGWAIAIPSENRILRERTMNADESINRFLEMRSYYPEGYAMWHARYATHGSKTVENCHPFAVGNDERTYLAHNGILDISIAKNDDRSDTKVFAEDLLPAIGGVASLDNELVFEMLEDNARGSKIAIITVDPAAKHQAYLLNAEAGKEDEQGVWWSNDSCKLDYGYGISSKSKTSTWVSDKDYDFWTPSPKGDKSMWYECANCAVFMDNEMLETYDDTCYACGFCFSCSTVYTDCMCYRGYAKQGDAFNNGWGKVDY